MRASEFARRRARILSDKGLRFRPHGPGFRKKALRALIRRARAAYIVPHGRFVGFRLPDGGVACEKQRFRSQGAAMSELDRIAEHAAREYVPVRAYQCDWCSGWHLTSRK